MRDNRPCHDAAVSLVEGRLLRRQAAEMAGIGVDTFSAYVTRGQAPGPVEYVGSTPLWDTDAVQSWVQTRPGRPGRPPKTGRGQ